MSLPEITLVVGIDAKTIEQLAVSWPTWKKNRPQMWHWPWIIFYDAEQIRHRWLLEMADEIGKTQDIKFAPWPPAEIDRAQYESQRDLMLSGHVFVPAMNCDTEYYCKLDTDALARPSANPWPDQRWFDDQPAVIAPRWGYSKGRGWLGRLEDWGDKVLAEHPPLGCREWPNYSPDAMRVGHNRWCSWCSFYMTSFAKYVASLCAGSVGFGHLPIPSQDTTMWYVAERMKATVAVKNQKAFGWSNHSRIDELRMIAAEIMASDR